MDATTCQDNRYETNEYLAPELAHLTIRVRPVVCSETTKYQGHCKSNPAQWGIGIDEDAEFSVLAGMFDQQAECSRG